MLECYASISSQENHKKELQDNRQREFFRALRWKASLDNWTYEISSPAHFGLKEMIYQLQIDGYRSDEGIFRLWFWKDSDIMILFALN